MISLLVFAPQEAVERLWHFAFNRLPELNEELVAGRERLYFGWQFATKAAVPLAASAVDVYVASLSSSREALHASSARTGRSTRRLRRTSVVGSVVCGCRC